MNPITPLAALIPTVCLTLAPPPAPAQPPQPVAPTQAAPEAAIPDTPIGQDMRWILAAFGPDRADMKLDRFSASFLAQVPAERLAQVQVGLAAQVGDLLFDHLEGAALEKSLIAVCRSDRDDSHWRILLNHDAAGQIEGLLIQPAQDLNAPPPAPAQPPQPVDAPQAAPEAAIPDTPIGQDMRWILAAFGPDRADMKLDRFSASFLAQVPAERLAQVQVGLAAQIGALRFDHLEGAALEKSLIAVCRSNRDDSNWRILLNHDAAGQIEGLLIQPALDLNAPPPEGWDDVKGQLAQLPGQVSFGAWSMEASGALRELASVEPDTALAIGSTFKLYVLGALAERVGTGAISWDDALAIQERYKSLPSGEMQGHPDGMTFPVSHFAARMISISDNTATDHLLHLVGRERVEAYMARLNHSPERNIPFLSTRDMFVMKLGGDPELAPTYVDADAKARRTMLADDGPIQKGTPSLLLAAAWHVPKMIDSLEWFASADDCARVMADMHRLAALDGQEPVREAMSINPGVPIDRAVWFSAFYKGGSEPGVLNFTWLLERRDGRRFVLSIGVNDQDQAVDATRVLGIAVGAITLLESSP